MTLFSIISGALAALLVGFSKTGVPGLGILIVPLMAGVFPDDPKLCVGALLPMLICGDIFAVARYTKHTQWQQLLTLLPYVALGMAPGLLVLHYIDGSRLKPLLGTLVLALVVLEVLRRRYKWEHVPSAWWFTALMGVLAGFATAVGNVAGPVMGIYLLSRGYSKEKFVGTGAWFYFIVNLSKIPFYINSGLFSVGTLTFNAWAAGLIIAGVILGYLVLPRIPRTWFERVIFILAAAGGIRLFF